MTLIGRKSAAPDPIRIISLRHNSNHIEGSCLTQEQTRFIFETSTVYAQGGVLPVDDIIETRNHFKCIDMVIREAKKPLTQALIKRLHFILKSSTAQAGRYPAGEYKKLPNTVGGLMTAPPELVEEKMRELLARYNAKEQKSLDDLIDFHCAFERIHPFQDGNGRVGRLILFKECLKYGIVPFIIDSALYHRRKAQTFLLPRLARMGKRTRLSARDLPCRAGYVQGVP